MNQELANFLIDMMPSDMSRVFFACVGTDRSTGDSLGPLVGTMLASKGYVNVVGDIDDPLHAVNMDKRLEEEIPEGSFVIAIDACLGRQENVGKVRFHDEPLLPGAGVKKNLKPVGDISVTGVVNISGFMEYEVLQNTRLKVVLDLAYEIVDSILTAIELKSMDNDMKEDVLVEG